VATLLIVLLTFACYAPGLANQFVDWDDGTYVFDNPHIKALNADFFAWAFFRFYSSNWHPFTWLSHGLDWAIWGANPFGHHLGNNLLHAANTGIVILLVLRLIGAAQAKALTLNTESFPNAQGKLFAAVVTGLLFGLHPLHVESVAWVAERKDLLCAFFYLLALLVYSSGSWYADDTKADLVSHVPGKYFLCLTLFMFALMSKPMAVTLPVILLLLDWYPFGRLGTLQNRRRAVMAKLPFFIISFGSAVLTILAQKAGSSLSTITSIPVGARLTVAMKSIVIYCGKLLLPLHLVPFYPYPDYKTLFTAPTYASIATVIAISACCFWRVRHERLFAASWIYFLVTLLPVLGIVQVGRQSMADRYAYLPSIAPLLLIGLGAAWLVARWQRSIVFVASAVLAISMLLGSLTVQQLRIWKDSISLWNTVIDNNPAQKIDFAFNNRAIAWNRRGELEKAASDFSKAIAANPKDSAYYNNRGTIYNKLRRTDEALADYYKALELTPREQSTYYNIACIYALRNMEPEACTWLRKSIKLGYDSWEDMKADHDLDNIRQSSCYRELLPEKSAPVVSSP
jgi:hypothetical protein